MISIRQLQSTLALRVLAQWMIRRWSVFLTHVPGTRRFRQAYRRSIACQIRERLMLFDSLQALDAATKHRLRPIMRATERSLAITSVRAEASLTAMLPLVLCLLLSLARSVMAPIVTGITGEGVASGWSAIATLFGLVIMLGPSYAALRRPKAGLATAVVLLGMWPAGLALSAAAIVWQSTPGSTIPLLYLGIAFVNLIPTWLAILGMIVLFLVAFYTFERWKRCRYPSDVIIDGLLRVLGTIERDPRQWADIDAKQRLYFRLKWIAACLEHDMMRSLRTGDARTDAEWRGACRKMAHAVQPLLGWVCAPSTTTRNEVISSVASRLVCAADGYWGDFERGARLHRGVKQLIIDGVRTLARFYRTLFAAGLPFMLLWGVQHTSFAFTASISDAIKVFGFIWALIVCGSTWIPNFGVTIAAVKELLQSLPFSGRSHP